jgi:hypothetical protein
MNVIFAYVSIIIVLCISDRLDFYRVKRTADQAARSGWPINMAPRLRRGTLVSGLARGIFCGLIFVFVGRSSPMLHATILATIILVGLHVVSWLSARQDSGTGGLPITTNQWSDWPELAVGFVPFCLALFVSTRVALYLAT